MISCPFCGHANEEGTLFCETCKTDLTIPAPVASDVVPEPVGSNSAFEKVASPESALPGTHKLDYVPILDPISNEPPTVGDFESPPTQVPTPDEAGIEPTTPTDHSIPAVSAPARPQPTVNPKIVVIRGERVDMEYRICAGKNYIGRTDDKPVDIDLENQEPPDRIWSSRQHAVITFENGAMTIEDLNSLNGTFVNRSRVHPGQAKPLQANDIIQIGTVQMKVMFG